MPAEYLTGAQHPPKAEYDADIIILFLDRAEETNAAIMSALAQQGILRHVTVVDQGSCPIALARIRQAVEGRPDITLLSLGRNHGVPAGRNVAASFGHGRIIIGLDNDAEFATADTAARAVSALDAEPDLAALGFRILRFGTSADDLSSWGYPAPLLARASDSFETVTFVGAGHAIRRTAWNQLGGYDPSLFFCWEEYEFSLRAIAAGWRIRYRDDIAIAHKVSPERRVCWSSDRWFYFVRNRVRIERRWGASWLALCPRVAGYMLRGARNRRLGATVAGCGRRRARNGKCVHGGRPLPCDAIWSCTTAPGGRARLRGCGGRRRGAWGRKGLRDSWIAVRTAARRLRHPPRADESCPVNRRSHTLVAPGPWL